VSDYLLISTPEAIYSLSERMFTKEDRVPRRSKAHQIAENVYAVRSRFPASSIFYSAIQIVGAKSFVMLAPVAGQWRMQHAVSSIKCFGETNDFLVILHPRAADKYRDGLNAVTRRSDFILGCCHASDTVYAVRTPLDVKELFDKVAASIPSDESLIVARLAGPWMGQRCIPSGECFNDPDEDDKY
jgi:hypothetical protein